MLDRFVPQGGCVSYKILKSLCFSGVEVESVEDWIVDVANGGGREQFEAGGVRFGEGECVAE